MRYTVKAKKLVHKLHDEGKTAEEIAVELANCGFRNRVPKSVLKVANAYARKKAITEKKRKAREAWALRNPIRYRAMTLVSGAKGRAKKKGIPFDLTVEWVEKKLIAGKCEVTGIPFDIKTYSKNGNLDDKNMYVPSLDQVKPSAGYTMDNVQVVVFNYNTLKHAGTLDDALRTATALVLRYRPELIVESNRA